MKTGNDYTKVRLDVSNHKIEPGSQLLLVFTFIISKDWHIYWQNPGDSGLPTKIEIENSNNFEIDDIFWPAPVVFKWDEFTNYGYKDSVKLILPISIPKNTPEGRYELNSKVSWLVCKEECLPGNQNFKISFEVADKSEINPELTEINLNNYPFKLKNINSWSSIRNDTLILNIAYNSSNYGKVYAEFYPLEEGYYIYSNIKSNLTINNNIEVILPLDNFRESNPTEINGLLVIKSYETHNPIISFYINSIIN